MPVAPYYDPYKNYYQPKCKQCNQPCHGITEAYMEHGLCGKCFKDMKESSSAEQKDLNNDPV